MGNMEALVHYVHDAARAAGRPDACLPCGCVPRSARGLHSRTHSEVRRPSPPAM